MKTYKVEVVQLVEVTLDETKFTEEFMEEFRESFFPFFDIEDHAEHIAQLHARDVYQGMRNEFVEGYAVIDKEFGVKVKVLDTTTEIRDDNW